ncbi:LOW QUALITY PROTEIN: uncharacterized protein LOC102716580 [Oryza brachyantha]|uniref:LOW QUALITY PROTEIN: uncharacterized protein LOC102716580 n=1 Tax=Oryza brachyantha TaxID=4533 RepID=UPI001ADA6CA0|nr:LOW QUALITY PROTEIN: uncharacterized protein LOC102716580 [Oryza brachyantha]
MAASPPVEVGARGTIGSLVCREIEYFRRVDQVGVVSHGHGKIRSSSSSNSSKQARRQRHGEPQEQGPVAVEEGGRRRRAYFLPSICSSAEVAEAAGAARVRYRHLGQDDGDSLPQ